MHKTVTELRERAERHPCETSLSAPTRPAQTLRRSDAQTLRHSHAQLLRHSDSVGVSEPLVPKNRKRAPNRFPYPEGQSLRSLQALILILSKFIPSLGKPFCYNVLFTRY